MSPNLSEQRACEHARLFRWTYTDVKRRIVAKRITA
jgi:hypothetical protein